MAASSGKPQVWIIYQATCLVHGKRYIGFTGQSLAGRRAGHKGQALAGKPTPFANAIRMHGIESFRFSILKTCLTKMEAALEEVRLIAALKPEYNASPGGEGALPPSPEQLALFMEGRRQASERRKRPVICLTDGNVFESSAESADYYQVSRSGMCLHLKGTIAALRDRIFMFYTGQEKRLENAMEQVAVIRGEQRRKMVERTYRREVVCINDGKKYPSAIHAAEAYGLPLIAVRAAIRGRNPDLGGIIIQHADPSAPKRSGRK